MYWCEWELFSISALYQEFFQLPFQVARGTMAASTSTSHENGLQVQAASGMRAYVKNPSELAVHINEGMLILFSVLYHSFYQLLFADVHSATS